jgi:acyl-ACP thioesterase
LTAAASYPDRIEFAEMISPPAGGRVYTKRAMPGLADCAPSGRARLDALARMLQDVAYADVEDAGLHEVAVWVVRRYRIRVERFPRFADRLMLHTFCSGIGRAWAERRTTIESEDGEALVETVSLWVHLDPVTWHPAPFSEGEIDVYGATAGDRRISHRLRHPPPPSDASESVWTFRAAECDVADHVNNAAYWVPFEDELLGGVAPDPDSIDVEMEFRTPAQPGEKRYLSAGNRRWLTAENGEVHASLLIGFSAP